MRHHSLSILATSVFLAFSASAAFASSASTTTQNLTLFSATKAGSATEALKAHAKSLNLPATLDNLVLVNTKESLLGKHYHYQQMLRGLPVEGAEVVVSIGHTGQLLKIYNESKPTQC
jgi:zinc metalloprotease ZmpB